MSHVSYFQHYSQPENHATNNTLLILRYFYQSSPLKLQNVLEALIGSDTKLVIGPAFEQQIKLSESVPDALISQEPLNIYIETKHSDKLYSDQIKRHLNSISELIGANPSRTTKPILIGLTKEPISSEQRDEFDKLADARQIGFASVTFSQVVEALGEQCAPYEAVLTDILNDYQSFLEAENLMDTSRWQMVVFPCPHTSEENKRYRLYYEPIGRKLKPNKIIGLSWNKQVALVGTVQAVVACSYPNKDTQLELKEVDGKITDKQRGDVKDAIENTVFRDGNSLKQNILEEPHHFYLVDEFVETSLSKTSPRGVRSWRYLDVGKIIGPSFDSGRNYTTAEIAALLRGKTFD